MKLSAIFAVSLPIVAITQMPALAGGQPADTGSWLKESLASLNSHKHATKPAHKVSHASPAHSASSTSLRLRPFMPNRYLPRENDLRQAMVAQQAKFDYSVDPSAGSGAASTAAAMNAGNSLSGQVSTYASAPRMVSQYDQYAMRQQISQSFDNIATRVARKIASSKKALGTRAPRLMPGQKPVLPEQLAAVAIAPNIIPDPPSQHAIPQQLQIPPAIAQAAQAQASRLLEQVMVRPRRPQQSQSAVQSVQSLSPEDRFSPQQQAELERLVAINKPTAHMDINGDIVGTVTDNPAYGTGQPPFPLNISPMNAMQTLQATRHPAPVQQARFGSWHDHPSLNESGFHSYLAWQKPKMFEFSRAPLAATHPSTTARPRISKPRSKKKVPYPSSYSSPPPSSRTIISRTGASAKVNTKPFIATYPVYQSAHGAMY